MSAPSRSFTLYDRVTIESDFEPAVVLKTGDEFIGKRQSGPGIGDKDFEFWALVSHEVPFPDKP
jgi:hypothetical protein